MEKKLHDPEKYEMNLPENLVFADKKLLRPKFGQHTNLRDVAARLYIDLADLGNRFMQLSCCRTVKSHEEVLELSRTLMKIRVKLIAEESGKIGKVSSSTDFKVGL